MKFSAIVVLVYSILVLLGGLIGYLFANSLPSLIAGSVFGAALFASGLGLLRVSKFAFFTALASTGILVGFFTYRYWTTGQLTPSGMMAGISILVFILLITSKTHSK